VANSHYVRQPIGIVLAGCFRGLAERLAQKVVARFRFNRDELIRVFGLPDRVIAVVVVRPAGAATLLASVEPRSTPDGCVLVSFPRHRPARPGGAVFNTVSPVASLGEPRPSALNIALRWQAAWWRGRSIRGDPVLVLNIARRRQAPPWRPTLRSPDPSVGLTVGLRPSLPAIAFSASQNLPQPQLRNGNGIKSIDLDGTKLNTPLPTLFRPSLKNPRLAPCGSRCPGAK
jgi:hypothetical protein